MNIENINYWIQIWDLCNSINEGVHYLSDHFYDKQISTDIKDGLCILTEHLKHNPNILPVLNYLNDNITLFPLNEAPSNEHIKTLFTANNLFCNTICSTVCQSLLSELENEPYIDYDIAKKIFYLWDCAPHQTPEIFQLTFNTCNKSSLSAPLESFEYTLKLFEEQPEILSGSDALHPNYTYRPSKQRTFDKCLICGGTGTPYHRAFSYKMSNFSHPHLPVKLWMKCNTCGNFYTWKHPEEHLALSSHSELILPDKNKYLTTLGDSTAPTLALWSEILNQTRTYSKGTSLLEVGIGNGDLLAVALELQYNVDAVEIVPSSAQRVSNMLNIPIWNGDFLQYESSKKYDVIIMGDVIEHITNPKLALQKAKQLLNDNGVLWLSTPNYESAFSRIHKLNDPMWKVANHLTYFSYQGLKTLAEECGFTIQKYSISQRYNGSMELILTA